MSTASTFNNDSMMWRQNALRRPVPSVASEQRRSSDPRPGGGGGGNIGSGLKCYNRNAKANKPKRILGSGCIQKIVGPPLHLIEFL